MILLGPRAQQVASQFEALVEAVTREANPRERIVLVYSSEAPSFGLDLPLQRRLYERFHSWNRACGGSLLQEISIFAKPQIAVPAFCRAQMHSSTLCAEEVVLLPSSLWGSQVERWASLKEELESVGVPFILAVEVHHLGHHEEAPVIAETPPSPGPFRSTLFAGTFDRLHSGHRMLLMATRLLTQRGGRMSIGITCGGMLASKPSRELIQPWDMRAQAVEQFIHACAPDDSVEVSVFRVTDPVGPAATADDLDCILGTEETLPGCLRVNEARVARGLPPLEVVAVDTVSGAATGKVSSTDLRREADPSRSCAGWRDLAARWLETAQRIGVTEGAAVAQWSRLADATSQPWRGPEGDLRRVARLLALLDVHGGGAADADALELAVWFHLVHYDPLRTDGPARSARAFMAFAEGPPRAHLRPERVTRVATLVALSADPHAPRRLLKERPEGDSRLLLEIVAARLADEAPFPSGLAPTDDLLEAAEGGRLFTAIPALNFPAARRMRGLEAPR